MPPDLYATLGVGRTADAAALRTAYRSLAKRYHPDVSREPDAHHQFIRITEAYEILSDPLRRKRYDLALQQRSRPTGPSPRQQQAAQRDREQAKARAEQYSRMRYQQFDQDYFSTAFGYVAPKMLGCLGIIVVAALALIFIGVVIDLLGLPLWIMAILIFASIPAGAYASVRFDAWHNRRQRDRYMARRAATRR